jgi:hypothetical protein
MWVNSEKNKKRSTQRRKERKGQQSTLVNCRNNWKKQQGYGKGANLETEGSHRYGEDNRSGEEEGGGWY